MPFPIANLIQEFGRGIAQIDAPRTPLKTGIGQKTSGKSQFARKKWNSVLEIEHCSIKSGIKGAAFSAAFPGRVPERRRAALSDGPSIVKPQPGLGL